MSPVGFGCYRVGLTAIENRRALRAALLGGCNLIDTSTNYGDGDSEKLVGEVLRDLFVEGLVERDQLVIVSKAGYIQGSMLEVANRRAQERRPYPEVVQYTQDLWHCISPPFLEDQISRSLQRLGLEHLDVFLIHNPEYFLKADSESGLHKDYYDRLHHAFKFLEHEVARGRILHYGVSSNTFPEPTDFPEYTSLETVWNLAMDVSDGSADHHFSVVQMPLNLYEPGAVLEKNNSGLSCLEFAKRQGLGVLVNRPLNAFVDDRLVRLAGAQLGKTKKAGKTGGNDRVRFGSSQSGDDQETGTLEDALTDTMNLESELGKKSQLPMKQLGWGHLLSKSIPQLRDLEQWEQLLNMQIRPQRDHGLEQLGENQALEPWVSAYRQSSERLFNTITKKLRDRQNTLADRISGVMDRECLDLRKCSSLPDRCSVVYRSLPGLSSVLFGMRRPEYVKELLALKPQIDAKQAVTVLEAIQSSARKEFR